MTITYFLNGSYKDVDNDFEIKIQIVAPEKEESNPEIKGQYTITLNDLSSEDKLSWQSTQDSFLVCLNDLDEFIIENNIKLYSKILTSTERNNAVDKELEGFILNRIEY